MASQRLRGRISINPKANSHGGIKSKNMYTLLSYVQNQCKIADDKNKNIIKASYVATESASVRISVNPARPTCTP